jgi:hypothetical protein
LYNWEQIQPLIDATESGGDYNALYNYQNRPDGRFSGVRLTEMPISDVLSFTNPQGEYASYVRSQVGRTATPVGRYQVVGSTLRDAVNALGIDPSTPFNQETQDRIGRWIFENQGPQAWEGLTRGGNMNGLLGGGPVTASSMNPQQPEQNRFFNADTRDRLIMALQGMTLNPNQALIQTAAQGIQQRAAQRQEAAQNQQQRNATADWLDAQGRTDLAQAVRSEALTAAQALQMFGGSDPSAKEQQISRLMEGGIDRNTAIGIVDGRLTTSRNPDTGQVQIVDVATGRVLGAPDVTAPTDAGTDGVSVEPSETFDDANVQGALGARGLGAAAINVLTDAFGMGQAFPEIGRAQQALENLSTRTMLGLSAEFPGRPSNLTRERIEDMTIKPAELTTGSENALNRTSEMRRLIERSITAARAASAPDSQLSPTQRTQARQSLGGLEDLLADYIALERALSANGSNASIRPEVSSRLGAYE